MKILYISDSLGTPIHPRGIFNFSISLVEILKDAGADIDLLVEGADDFSLEGRFGGLAQSAPEAVNSVRLSEIHRYFNQAHFGFRWGYKTPRIKFLAERSRPLIDAWLGLRERMNYRPNVVVRNDVSKIDFVPPKSEHLGLFDNLIVKRSFYSSSMSRANLGLAPPLLEISGYDLAIVDTPHYMRLKGIDPKRVLTVVHDLIPLRDPTMDVNWRNLFMRKLDATLAIGANMVFVSQYTQNAFRSAFGRHKTLREFIVHPAIRRQLMIDAELAEGPAASGLRQPPVALADLAAAPPAAKRKRTRQKRAGSLYGGNDLPAGFDPVLPYFVTATSDEPRKNIATIVYAFYQHLRGRANIVILGEINSYRYDPGPDANVYFPGYVTDAEKVAYLRASRGVIFASLSEGFGIPIVEGAVMGLPVLCSDIEVFREVAGEDGAYFDPRDPTALARVVEETLADEEKALKRASALQASALARFSQAAVGKAVRAALCEIGLKAPR